MFGEFPLSFKVEKIVAARVVRRPDATIEFAATTNNDVRKERHKRGRTKFYQN